jgi:hypothetical protein
MALVRLRNTVYVLLAANLVRRDYTNLPRSIVLSALRTKLTVCPIPNYRITIATCWKHVKHEALHGIQYGSTFGLCGKRKGRTVNVHKRHERRKTSNVHSIIRGTVSTYPSNEDIIISLTAISENVLNIEEVLLLLLFSSLLGASG